MLRDARMSEPSREPVLDWGVLQPPFGEDGVNGDRTGQ